MRLIAKGSIKVGLIVWILFAALPALAQAPPIPKPFMVFDATVYANKPNLSAYGLRPITLLSQGHFGADWYKYADRLPDIEAVHTVARDAQLKGHPVVLDIEHWPLDGQKTIVDGNLAKYLSVLHWFRQSAPGLSTGYYGAPPLRDYWRALKDVNSQERLAWMTGNDRLHSLAGTVDALYPSLYTFYPDQAGWKAYAIAQIEEARRYGEGKPVYAFLWPQYHDSNPSLNATYLPADYWQLELETARQYADGIVIWGGWDVGNRPAIWDDTAAWWKVTKEFLRHEDLSPPAAPRALTIR